MQLGSSRRGYSQEDELLGLSSEFALAKDMDENHYVEATQLKSGTRLSHSAWTHFRSARRSIRSRNRLFAGLVLTFLVTLVIVHYADREGQAGSDVLKNADSSAAKDLDVLSCDAWDPSAPEVEDPPGCLKAKQYRQTEKCLQREESDS